MIEPAAFESGIVGRPIWRVVDLSGGNQLAAELAACPHHVIAKADGSDFAGINTLLANGFRYCGASNVMTRPGLGPVGAGGTARVLPLDEADLAVAGGICDAAFGRRNRFADDPVLAPFATRIHRQWLTNSLAGYAQACVKAELDGVMAGFATLHVTGAQSSLGLIAVDAARRGAGIGRALAAHLIAAAARSGCAVMKVVTESANAAALDFYAGLGFRHTGSELSLYRPAP